MALTKVLSSIVALLLVGVASPASGASGKVKPYRSETATIEIGKWAPYGDDPSTTLTITAAEFLAKCAIPTETQGFDAYVFAVPRPYRTIEAEIRTRGKGVDATGTVDYHDIDIYIYDANCSQIAEYTTTGGNERGVLPAGSAFILLQNYAMTVSGPAQVSFRLEPLIN